jgi:hypothetical protein
VRKALEDLPWVDGDQIEINSEKQVRLTITDMKQYDEKKLKDALSTAFSNVRILEKPN